MMQTQPQPLLHQPLSSEESFPHIAATARVIHELRTDPQQNDDVDVSDDFDFDFDFEFSFVSRHPDSSPVSADDIFYNGQIRPIYPLFHQNVVADASVTSIPTETARRRRLPLRTLMFEEPETVNDLHGVAEGTYCVWTPPCKKTSSSSNRWNIRNLLPRSHSDGKRTSKVAPKHSSTTAKKFVGFFTNANGLGRNFQLSN